MKKIFNFIRSMRFGIILLLLIALCSVAGSLINQGNTMEFYAKTYGSFHGVIMLLGLDDVFKSWYFVLLLVLLCVNLSLCSLVRFNRIRVMADKDIPLVTALPTMVQLNAEGRDKLKASLRKRRCRELKSSSGIIFRKNSLGRYGTFITHLSILLTVIFGAGVLYLPKVTDQTCFPGESIVMQDGTEIYVDSFSILGEDGELDYASVITMTAPNGEKSEPTKIRVNYPMNFGNYKVYQQTYGTAGSITVRNTANNGVDTFILTEYTFLSLDAVNGLWYETLYPGFIRDEDGNYTLISSTSGRYEDPLYQVLVASDGVYTPTLAQPGDTLTVGELEYTFDAPVEYPGLRIKYTPGFLNAMLIFVFLLMTAGLYITFFMTQVLVKVTDEGYTVAGAKPETELMKLRIEFAEYERNKEC